MASIVIFEDDKALLKRSLEREGYSFSRASHGISGLAQAQEAQADLILMNMRCWKWQGECVRQLKAMPRNNRDYRSFSRGGYERQGA